MEDLRNYLLSAGASLVGYADLSQLPAACRADLPRGVAIAIALDTDVVKRIPSNTTAGIDDYRAEYNSVNEKLDALCLAAGAYIENLGYRAVSQTVAYMRSHDPMRALLPHKTVAALSGFGWISKSALLITPQYGSALRLTSVLTDMPLEASAAEYTCKCGSCTRCVDICPGGAIKNVTWDVSLDGDDLIDFEICKEAGAARSAKYSKEGGPCGLCVAVCPHTQKHL